MTLLIVLIVLPLILLVVLLYEAFRVTPLVIASVNFIPIIIGYSMIDKLSQSKVAVEYLLALIAFVGGYGLGKIRLRHHYHAPNCIKRFRSAKVDSRVGWLLAVVMALVTYHFAVGGIPLFSPNGEVSRFSFDASGLFGIPGRMLLFGLPFTVLMISVTRARGLAKVSKGLSRCAWGGYICFNLLSGFKGGIVAVVTTYILAKAMSGKPVSIRSFMSPRYVALAAVIVLIIFRITVSYTSLAVANSKTFVTYALERPTELAAAPGYFAMTTFAHSGNGAYYARDLRYLIGEYLHRGTVSDIADLPLDKTVSSQLYNTPTNADAFIVPVTLGAFPEMVVNLGFLMALLGMSCIGFFLRVAYRRVQTCRSVFKTGAYGLAVQLVLVYLTNGNLIYLSINATAVILFLYLIFRWSGWLAKRAPQRPQSTGVRTGYWSPSGSV